VKIKGNKKKMMSAHTFEIFEKKNKKMKYTNKINEKEKNKKVKEKRGGKPKKNKN